MEARPLGWSGSRTAKVIGLLRFLQALRRANPDVLLPFTMPPNIVCGLLWRWSGARTCIWNQRDEGRQRFPDWLERRAVRNTPLFISNSAHAAELLIRELGAARDSVEVIPNGIAVAPPRLGRDAWRHRLGISPEASVACMVANLHAFKDHPTLLRAWSLVKEAAAPKLPVLLLASHDYGAGAELRTLAEQLGVADLVRFLGHVDDVSGLLNASDIGVYSSFKEGVPNGVLECMAAGLPVVATDIPGTRKALGPEGFRFLVEPQDPEALAGGVLELLADAALRRSAAERSLERAREHFDPEAMCERYCRQIARALAPAPGEHN